MYNEQITIDSKTKFLWKNIIIIKGHLIMVLLVSFAYESVKYLSHITESLKIRDRRPLWFFFESVEMSTGLDVAIIFDQFGWKRCQKKHYYMGFKVSKVFFVLRERQAIKNSFIAYLWSTLDVSFWTDLYWVLQVILWFLHIPHISLILKCSIFY